MKQITKLSLLALLTVIVLNSCSVQKRVYNRGLHIEWFDNHKGSDKSADVQAKKAQKHQMASTEQTHLNNFVTEEGLNEEQKESGIATDNSSGKTIFNGVRENTSSATTTPASVSLKQTIKAGKQLQKLTPEMKKISKSAPWKAMKSEKSADVDIVLLYILCFLIPPVAVGLATDWEASTVIINILWCLLCGIPGVIHAIIVVSREA